MVPWREGGLPRFSVFAQLRRTREGSLLSVRDPDSCHLLLWKRPQGLTGPSVPSASVAISALLADAVTGCTGIWSVAVDCSLELDGEPWVITSGEFHLRKTRLSGPHYAPLAACHGSALARIDISSCVDARRLLADLRSSIANPAIRHNGARESLDFLLARMREERVNCSSLAGRAILKQPSSLLAKALRQALRDRFTWGDVTPADLARATAILKLCPSGAATPVRQVPIFPVPRRGAGGPALNPLHHSSEAQS